MNTKSNANNACPRCGALLHAGTTGGLCPVCLLQEGIGSRHDSASATELGAREGTPSRSAAPSIAEIQDCFPALEILGLLGQGGMGVVYKARQPQLDRMVALKILPGEPSCDPAFAERFSREARAMARLNHPNIVGVYDFGQARGHYYLIMEFVDGMTLRQLERTRPLSPKEALAITPRICEALQYAHDEGIVHRDIKPGNILVDRKGRVKIADFGLAKLLGEAKADFELTGDRQVMGTPHYMAPEQMAGSREVDHRADIYSLGVVIYEMLTGELPMGRFAPPSKKVQVDARLDEVVLKALESDPALRFQRVSDVKSEIDSITGPLDALHPRVRAMLGFEYKSPRKLWGMPLLHISSRMDPATGVCPPARGVIAIGGRAIGVIAFGGWARGVFAFGGLAIGVVSVGGISFGVFSLGGIALALAAAFGGMAIGSVAYGGFAAGILASGGMPFSLLAARGVEASPLSRSVIKLMDSFWWVPVVLILVNLSWVAPVAAIWLFGRKAKREGDAGARRT